jgi:UDP-glucose 4-epimerase
VRYDILEANEMRVAVTGSSGFIGARVCEELEFQGHDFVGIDHQQGIDILGPGLTEAMENCDGVIHLAGVLGTAELFDNAEMAIEVNVKGTLRVLQAAQEHGLAYVGITMPPVWDNVYQATKSAACQLAAAWHRHHDLRVSHVRAFNVFGPGQKVGLPQKIVPTFASRAWLNEPIPVWGNGKQTVDLVYVDHVARMLVEALRFGDDEIFDAGTGEATTVNQVAQWVLDITGSTAGVAYLPMRMGEHGQGVVAGGEGWQRLHWYPVFGMEEFTYTVETYRSVIMGPTWTQQNSLS